MGVLNKFSLKGKIALVTGCKSVIFIPRVVTVRKGVADSIQKGRSNGH